MADRCIRESCLKKGKFSCICNSDIKFCSNHIRDHANQEGEHRSILLAPELNEMKLNTKKQKLLQKLKLTLAKIKSAKPLVLNLTTTSQ